MSKIHVEQFKEVMGRFVTGVTVVATGWGDRLHAMTANAVTSVSLDPLRVLVCVKNGSHCLAAIERENVFAINILREDQAVLSVYFSGYWKGGGMPPFRFSLWKGVPRLHGAIATIGCEVVEMQPCGDHQIVIGAVQGLRSGSAGRPLVYAEGTYYEVGREVSRS
jgi:flavin reductase (DIM6/NTAB) family NADH-FMN oxidoreductase RutF